MELTQIHSTTSTSKSANITMTESKRILSQAWIYSNSTQLSFKMEVFLNRFLTRVPFYQWIFSFLQTWLLSTISIYINFSRFSLHKSRNKLTRQRSMTDLIILISLILQINSLYSTQRLCSIYSQMELKFRQMVLTAQEYTISLLYWDLLTTWIWRVLIKPGDCLVT